MTLSTHLILNSMFNQIHHWNEPEQMPMKRMFLTRLSEIACAVMEISSFIFKLSELNSLCLKQGMWISSIQAIKIFPHSQRLKIYTKHSFFPEIKAKAHELVKVSAGIISTLFIGIIFSPEINFRIHLKLGLVVDNLAEKLQRELSFKLHAEYQKAEISKARNKRFAKFEKELSALKEAEMEMYAVNSRLAELLLQDKTR